MLDDLDRRPTDAYDAYLRLHLLSHRLVRPHGAQRSTGIFGVLPNVAWTSLGPVDPAALRRACGCASAPPASRCRSSRVDKFPRMTDYVVPSGVRIADADRVRLGAHLAEGTTVMHEGFVNFNAGTLGASMVEGRISAGVVVGDGSDIGGGASIMGTLSGGGTEVISIGERCLLGANAGLGISLGDDCIVEAGLYVTAGTRVTLPDGEVVKARELSRRRRPAVPPQLADRRGRGDAALRRLGRPQRRPARQRLSSAAPPPARTRRASARARARRKPSPAGPKNEPGASTIAALEQLGGERVGALAGVEPEEERRVAARVADAGGLEHAAAATSRLAR